MFVLQNNPVGFTRKIESHQWHIGPALVLQMYIELRCEIRCLRLVAGLQVLDTCKEY